MAMSFEDLWNKAAGSPPAFCNGSQFEIWQWNTCRGCIHHSEDCPLIDVALAGRTPVEWTETGLGNYICGAKQTNGST